jgi:NADPH2:quinone reductase
VVSLATSTGAEVWGQVGQESKTASVQKCGARRVIVSDADELEDSLQELQPTVVVDPLGGLFTAAALRALQPRGRLVTFGTSAGADVTINMQNVYRRGQRIIGYGSFVLSDGERRSGVLAAIDALRTGRMQLPVDRVLPLESVNIAFDALRAREVAGELVLDLRQDQPTLRQ